VAPAARRQIECNHIVHMAARPELVCQIIEPLPNLAESDNEPHQLLAERLEPCVEIALAGNGAHGSSPASRWRSGMPRPLAAPNLRHSASWVCRSRATCCCWPAQLARSNSTAAAPVINHGLNMPLHKLSAGGSPAQTGRPAPARFDSNYIHLCPWRRILIVERRT